MANNIFNFFDVVDFWSLNELTNFLESSEGPIRVDINSPGGSILDGFAIASKVRDFKQPTTARIIGLAASMASVISLAFDETEIEPDAFFMIHNPWTFTMGESEDLRKEAEIMDSMRGLILDTYVDAIEKNGKLKEDDREKTRDFVSGLMDEETWMTGEQAVELGFITKLVDTSTQEAQNFAAQAKYMNCIKQYKNTPTKILSNCNCNKVEKMENNKDTETKKTFWEKFKAAFGLGSKQELLDALAEAEQVETETEAETNEETTETATTETVNNDELIKQLEEQGYTITKDDSEETEEDVQANAEPETNTELEELKKELEAKNAAIAEYKAKEATKPVGGSDNPVKEENKNNYTKEEKEAGKKFKDLLFRKINR